MMKKINKKVIFAVIILVIIGVFLKKINSTDKTNNNLTTSDDKKNTQVMSGTFTDERDQKTYKWVKIGEQIWMGENLSYKPESGFSSYEKSDDNLDTYGYLYDWKTAQNIAPEGWHLPSESEWKALMEYLGVHPGSQLKEEGTKHWQTPNADATNTSQFNALPGGGNFDGEYLMMGRKGFFWSSTEINDTDAYALTLENNSPGISWYSGTKVRELSVRCVKD